ncbi:hypothetical protein [Streptomyces sp. UG1]|uniref:hypothetical protein n=1 Tax=Streptomyces sp. UG1 TaxID=3417652 RepID=UPI003CF767AD
MAAGAAPPDGDGLLNGHNHAKAAIDIAAHDLIGKRLGVRVAELLGSGAVSRVPSCYALSVAEPDETARIAKERMAEGCPRIQVKLGCRPVEAGIETLHKVWEGVRGSGMRPRPTATAAGPHVTPSRNWPASARSCGTRSTWTRTGWT